MHGHVPLSRLTGVWNDPDGLSDSQAAQRMARFGPNAIVAESPRGWTGILRSTAGDPMIWFLVAMAVLFAWLGDVAEALVLAVATVPILGMDAFLHRRTQASTAGLSARLATRALAIRGGRRVEIPAGAVVPGDLVAVPAGSYFPADGVIVAGDNLQADESTLTGEALPVRKAALRTPPVAAEDAVVEAVHWGMAGTRLLTGEARMRVVMTGAETLYGEIARLSRMAGAGRTPLQTAIDRLVAVLVVVAVGLCAVLAAIRYGQGHGLVDALVSAATLAIAAFPEEFPVVFSFFLGLGVYRLARRQALVRRAVVVENIGRVTCICTDKTGTLTEGRLAIHRIAPARGESPQSLRQVAAAASRAESGDPVDLLLLEGTAPQAGPAVAVYPFTEDRRREVSVRRERRDRWRVAMKGAPETVLALCEIPESERRDWLARAREFAAGGHKVIAVATRLLRTRPRREPTRGYAFCGLVAFSDPVRPGVPVSVRRAREAGIRVIMITGDHPQTAGAIARETGIGGPSPEVLTGDAMMARLEGGATTRGIDVVARCTPSQKLALVEALRGEGELVAVTGDGVNDVPALRGASIGIAMGERGTRPAREVASIVLLDDNFSTIIRAIAEGRQLFDNLRLSFAYLLMIHGPLVATAALVPLLGYPLLYLPVHIVWIELIIHPTALLAFQNLPAADPAAELGRRGDRRFFTAREWASIVAACAIATAVTVVGYVYNFGDPAGVAHARSMAMAALIAASAALTAALSGLASRESRVACAASLASAAIAIQVGPLAAILHLSPLHTIDWAIALIGGLTVGGVAGYVFRRGRPSEPGYRPAM